MSTNRNKLSRREQNTPKAQQPRLLEEDPPSSEMIATFEQYEGSLPHPAIAREYEQILPGSFERLFDMVEKEQAMQERQQQHAIEMERKVVETNIYMARKETDIASRGQLLIFFVIIAFIVAGVVLLALDKDIEGFVAFAGALIPVVGLLIYRRQNRENSDKPDNEETEREA